MDLHNREAKSAQTIGKIAVPTNPTFDVGGGSGTVSSLE